MRTARADHKHSTRAVRSPHMHTADTPRPIHLTKALLELHNMHPAMLTGSNMRPRNAVAKVARACDCDQRHTRSEVST